MNQDEINTNAAAGAAAAAATVVTTAKAVVKTTAAEAAAPAAAFVLISSWFMMVSDWFLTGSSWFLTGFRTGGEDHYANSVLEYCDVRKGKPHTNLALDLCLSSRMLVLMHVCVDKRSSADEGSSNRKLEY